MTLFNLIIVNKESCKRLRSSSEVVFWSMYQKSLTHNLQLPALKFPHLVFHRISPEVLLYTESIL